MQDGPHTHHNKLHVPLSIDAAPYNTIQFTYKAVIDFITLDFTVKKMAKW